MSEVRINYREISKEAKSWQDWVELMNGTRSEVNGATPQGFSPDVVMEASTFLSTWVDLTTTMRDGVEDVVGSLDEVETAWRTTEDSVSEGYSREDD